MEKQGPFEPHQSTKQDRSQGRAPEEKSQRVDISQLDQQEGHMNNGKLGGNFDETPEDNNREKQ